jgi:hypothetical protein
VDRVQLLKADQLSMATPEGVSSFAFPTASTPADFVPMWFATLIGTLGVSRISKGPYRAWIPCYCANGYDGDATIEVIVEVVHSDLSTTAVVSGSTIPIRGDVATLQVDMELANDVAFIPDQDVLSMRCRAHSTATGGQMVYWTYSDPTHECRLDTPMQLPISVVGGGTTDHLKLAKTHQNVANGEEEDHPWCAVYGGRAHTELLTATLENSDMIVIMPDCNSAKVNATTVIAGIKTTGWMVGDKVQLWIYGGNPTGPIAVNNMTNWGTWPNVKPLLLSTSGTLPRPDHLYIWHSPATLVFQLDADYWLQIGQVG